MKRVVAAAALLVMGSTFARPQTTADQYRAQGYFFFAGAPSASGYFISNGVPSRSSITTSNSFQWGGGGEWISGHGLGLGGEYLKSTQYWEARRISLDTRIGSINVSYHFGPSGKKRQAEPFVTGGYTFFYAPGTGLGHDNGANFGAGLNVWLARRAGLRLEIRDDVGGQDLSAEFEPEGTYYLRSSQHFVGFRIGVSFR